jgi:hypothetical protein
MNKRAKEISRFLEKETEGIIDFYEYQNEGFDENEKYESDEMEDVFVRALIGYIEQRKKTKESGELLN